MCQTTQPIAHARITRCVHGTNYVTMGHVTLQLSDDELVLLDRTIHKLAHREPVLQRALYRALCDDLGAGAEVPS